MKGRSVATVSGFTLVPELKEVEGIGEVKLYDTTDGALRDLIAGRVDMAILDPPLMQLAIQENPDWNLHQVPLQPKPDQYLIMSQVYNVIFGINPELQDLHDAFNQEIGKIWADCTNVEVMAKYGLGDKSWFRRRRRARTCATASTGPRTGWRRTATTASERPLRARGSAGGQTAIRGLSRRLRLKPRGRDMDPLLRIVDLHKSFGALEVLKGSASRSRGARSCRSSGRAAPARPRCSGASTISRSRPPATSTSTAR